MHDDDREARLAELEARANAPRTLGPRTPLAVAGLVLSLYFLWTLRGGLAYLVSPREPITLGAEGDYHFDRLAPNRYAQVHGLPGFRGVYVQAGRQTRMAVGLQGTPLIVLRPLLPGEELTHHGKPPPPNPQPLGVRGRLLPEAEAGTYRSLFPALGPGYGWLLVQGERPGADLSDALVALVLVAFAALNGAVLWASATRRRRRQSPTS